MSILNKINTKEMLYRLFSELRGKIKLGDLANTVVACIFISHDNRRVLSELLQRQLPIEELNDFFFKKQKKDQIFLFDLS